VSHSDTPCSRKGAASRTAPFCRKARQGRLSSKGASRSGAGVCSGCICARRAFGISKVSCSTQVLPWFRLRLMRRTSLRRRLFPAGLQATRHRVLGSVAKTRIGGPMYPGRLFPASCGASPHAGKAGRFPVLTSFREESQGFAGDLACVVRSRRGCCVARSGCGLAARWTL